jgi:hypothetical protein
MSIPTANTSPISPAKVNGGFSPAALLSANTSLDGTGTTAVAVTAGTPDGAKVPRLRVMHRGSNVATVMRFFKNNGSSPATAANNVLIADLAIPANTLSQTASSIGYDVFLNQHLKQNEAITYSIGTAVAAGHAVSAPDTGDY